MIVKLYNNKSEVNALNKNINELKQVTGTLREQTSILTPVINIENIDNLIGQLNYAYIPEFHRYYFITGIDSVREGLWRVAMNVDVLYTYKDSILANNAIIERNELEFDLKLNDGLFRTQQNPRIQTRNFPGGFNTWDFVLAIAGN